MNNGFSTGYFGLERGVRQGDPLSPMLFILVLEMLLIAIISNKDIEGITVLENEIKVAAFADDMTCFLSDIKSAEVLFGILRDFHKCSGLRVNREKSEAVWLGSWKDKKDVMFGVKWPTAPIKIVGIFFSHNREENRRKNITKAIDN